MYDRLLLPVDGSDEARRAARRGLLLAKRFEAEAVALHVVESSGLRLTRTPSEEQALRDRGEAILSDVEELAADIGQPVTTELAEGKVVDRITSRATAHDTDLVVLGRQGLSGLGRRLLGGTTERVLARGICPVLVVPAEGEPATSGEINRLLVPTDGSENAERATGHASTVASRYDATVHVLNVVDLQAAGGAFDAGGLEAAFVDRLETAGGEAVERMARDLRDALADPTVETAVVTTAQFDGIAAGIESYVNEQAIDLVIMGSHGRSNVRRQVLGSVASTVLRTVDVPVLVVNRTE